MGKALVYGRSQVRHSVTQFPLYQTPLFLVLCTAFKKTLKISPEFECTHQQHYLLMKLLLVNLSLQNKWLLTFWHHYAGAHFSGMASSGR